MTVFIVAVSIKMILKLLLLRTYQSKTINYALWKELS